MSTTHAINLQEATDDSQTNSITTLQSSVTTLNGQLAGDPSTLKTSIDSNTTKTTNISATTTSPAVKTTMNGALLLNDLYSVDEDVQLSLDSSVFDVVVGGSSTFKFKPSWLESERDLRFGLGSSIQFTPSTPAAPPSGMGEIYTNASKDLVYKYNNSGTTTTYPVAGPTVFPASFVFKHSVTNTDDVYTDPYVIFKWDGINKQLEYKILTFPYPTYISGGLSLKSNTSALCTGNYFGSNAVLSGVYRYFSGYNASSPNTTYNCLGYGGRAIYYLRAEEDLSYPAYQVKVILGGVGNGDVITIEVKRFH